MQDFNCVYCLIYSLHIIVQVCGWWLCSLSTCFSWNSLFCFWLGWATKEILVWELRTWRSSHFVAPTYCCLSADSPHWPTAATRPERPVGQTALSSAGSSFQFWLLSQVCVSSVRKDPDFCRASVPSGSEAARASCGFRRSSWTWLVLEHSGLFWISLIFPSWLPALWTSSSSNRRKSNRQFHHIPHLCRVKSL